MDATAGATTTAHVVTFPWRRVPRALTEPMRLRRSLASDATVAFALLGPSSGGSGARNVNRTLSPRRVVVIAEWRDAEVARAGRTRLDDAWRARGAAVWSATLTARRAHGTIRGASPFRPSGEVAPAAGLVASLTFARIRPTRFGHFYVLGFPRSARRLTRDPSPMLAGIGFGDVPVRHACTFSLWPSEQALDALVHGRDEVHGIVSRRSTEEGWLSESLFARFDVSDAGGPWGGRELTA